jgi:iron complex outermembrane receptor protein
MYIQNIFLDLSKNIFILIKIATIPFFLFATFFGIGQYSITGIVKLEDRVVEGAQVLLEETQQQTYSLADGSFQFSNLTTGNYTLMVSCPGAIHKVLVVDPSSVSAVPLEIQLMLDLQVLEEVVISTNSLGLTNRTPYTVNTLEIKDVSFKGSPSGIMGLIQYEPGVNSADMGHGISKPFIRGLGFSRIATLYQGNKLENHQWGADHGLGLNDLGISSVEIVKGPASILYGSGAIGGVILLIDDESYLNTSTITGNVGSTFNSVSAGIRTYGSLGRKFKNGFFLAADAAAENHADYYDGNNRLVGNSRFNSQTIRIHTGIKKDRFHNKLSYTYNNQLLGIIDDNEMIDSLSLATFRSDRALQLPFQQVTDHLITYRQKMKHTAKVLSEITVSYHHNDRSEIEEDLDEIDLGLVQSHTFYTGKINYIHNNWRHTFGLQGSIVDMKNKREAKEILIPNALSFENGLYYLGTWRKYNHTLQGGLRFDVRYTEADANQANIVEQGYVLPEDNGSGVHGRLFTGFTGSLGYSYQFTKGGVLKSNLSSGYRAPDIAELFANGNHPGTNRFEVGNVNFNREQNVQLDASFGMKSKSFTYELSLFGNLVNNYIYFSDSGDTTASGLNMWTFNQTDVLLYGGEIYIDYALPKHDRLNLSLTGNLIRGYQLESLDPLTFIPADRVMLSAKYKPFVQKSFFIFSNLQQVFTQNRPGFNEERTNGYQLWSAGMKYELQIKRQTLTVALTGFNLLNLDYVDHISILRAFSIPSPGRNLMLNLQWKF